ncbi:MAG TPA: thermonuclease family protein [Thermoanaerobaculia bacterium]|nr:thermonuclease family protein [Thermoanaerobaculia bacterium]
MRKRQAFAGFVGLLMLGVGWFPAHAGDSLYGRVTSVKSGDRVTLDYGAGQYELRLEGIDIPKEGPYAEQAVRFLSDLVLGKNVRMRFEGREEDGTMKSRLYTDDPVLGIKEVNVELVRAGLARRQKDVDFKYGELSAAESEAQNARRGLWAADPSR